MKRLYPVIHVQNRIQALRNAIKAKDSGADGVFLINHENEDGVREINYAALLNIHAFVVEHLPDWWVGVNCLDLPAADLFQHLNQSVPGVWVDNGEIDEMQIAQPAAQHILDEKTKSGWQGEYFGGVAFKYQRILESDQQAAEAARIAINYIDTITTSGAATGKSAPVAKIKQMKQAIGAKPLALASGVSSTNVEAFLPWVDVFLVATNISQSFYELDIEKVRQLADIVHNWDSD